MHYDGMVVRGAACLPSLRRATSKIHPLTVKVTTPSPKLLPIEPTSGG
jgi:hypothetical protein